MDEVETQKEGIVIDKNKAGTTGTTRQRRKSETEERIMQKERERESQDGH